MNTQNSNLSFLLGLARCKAQMRRTFSYGRMQLTLVAILMSIFSTGVLLSSCSDDSFDTNSSSAQTDSIKSVTDFSKQLVGVHFDMSDVAMSGKGDSYGAIGIFDIKSDLSFTYYSILADSTGEYMQIDTLKGTVKPFVNYTYTLHGSEQMKTNGFTATFDSTSHEKIFDNVVMNYYDISDADDSLTFISEDCLDYCFMTTYGDFTTRSGSSSFSAEMKTKVQEPIEQLSKTLEPLKQYMRASELSSSVCKKFWNDSNEAVDKMKKAVGLESIDFSDWMGTIYNGKDPRICDMNIPGTHDSFTYGMQNTIFVIGATQINDIPGQWKAGARYFDVRFKKNGQITHKYECGCTVDNGIKIIEDLLTKHPNETAIMIFQVDGDEGEAEYKAIYDIMQNHKDHIVQNPTPGMKLSECKGKIIVFQDWDEKNNWKQYRIGPTLSSPYMRTDSIKIRFYNKGEAADSAYCYYQNICEYFFHKGYENFWREKQGRMLQAFTWAKDHENDTEPLWCVNPSSGYVGYLADMSYSDNANVMNPWTFAYVVNHRKDKMGIIPMDFAGINYVSNFLNYGAKTNGARLAEAVALTNKFR